MLNTYLAQVAALLQNPPAPVTLYSQATLTQAINTARGQIAADGQCVRRMGTLTLNPPSQQYAFSGIAGYADDVTGAIQVRTIWYMLGGGQRYITPKSFEWFSLYYLNTALNYAGPPKVWSQFGQGAAVSGTTGGSFFLGPTPDYGYALQLDTLCAPIPLVDDTTAEAIPPYWQDCVQFLAAWYALLGAQSTARQGDADRMFARYEEYRDRARHFANPSLLPAIWAQGQDVTLPAKLGLKAAS